MRHAGDAGGAERHRIGLAECDQLLDGLGRKLRVHVRHDRRAAQQTDRIEILQRVVRQRVVQRRIGCEIAHRHEQRVAVRRGLRGGGGADHGGGAGPRLDDDLLAPVIEHLLCDDPSQDVGRSARRERHDDLDRPVRIFVGRLGRGRARSKRCGDERGKHGTNGPASRAKSMFHDPPPVACAARCCRVFCQFTACGGAGTPGRGAIGCVCGEGIWMARQSEQNCEHLHS